MGKLHYDYEYRVVLDGQAYVFTADAGDDLGDVWSENPFAWLFSVDIRNGKLQALVAHEWILEEIVSKFAYGRKREREAAAAPPEWARD